MSTATKYILYKDKAMSYAEWVRQEIKLAEAKMPGIVALREEPGASKLRSSERIAGCFHMTTQTAMVIETSVDIDADMTWSSYNIIATQDNAAGAIGHYPYCY